MSLGNRVSGAEIDFLEIKSKRCVDSAARV
jgi:hypothetical protein